MWLKDLLPLNLPHNDGFMIWGIFTTLPCLWCPFAIIDAKIATKGTITITRHRWPQFYLDKIRGKKITWKIILIKYSWLRKGFRVRGCWGRKRQNRTQGVVVVVVALLHSSVQEFWNCFSYLYKQLITILARMVQFPNKMVHIIQKNHLCELW